MKRRTFDRIVSFVGLGLSVFLFVAAALLNWGASFANESVATQLSQQKITMPDKDSAGFKALSEEAQKELAPFSNMPLTTGKQAQTYADFYIGSHLKGIAGGKVYSEVSGMALGAAAKSKADPTNTELASQAATLMGQRQTLFMGETLKGLLGNAYAFWKMGQIAMYAAWAAGASAIVMLILSILGFMHLRRTPEGTTV